MGRDDLGNRMKDYEKAFKVQLDKNFPVIGRIDGKAFHTFTRGLDRPWDRGLQESMLAAAKYAAERMQGCKTAYAQSDEISFLLTAYEKETTQGWFNYKLEKMVSVAASLVTGGFIAAASTWLPERTEEFLDGSGLPAFDARFFNLPHDEVTNYFWWRQQDAIRNSVQMLARAHFSHKECDKKGNAQLKEMLLTKGISWDDQLHRCKYGATLVQVQREEEVRYQRQGVPHTITVLRNRWDVDNNIPLFYQERGYIDCLL
jgi:tRNA(His) 5'-end guanylyltransferase